MIGTGDNLGQEIFYNQDAGAFFSKSGPLYLRTPKFPQPASFEVLHKAKMRGPNLKECKQITKNMRKRKKTKYELPTGEEWSYETRVRDVYVPMPTPLITRTGVKMQDIDAKNFISSSMNLLGQDYQTEGENEDGLKWSENVVNFVRMRLHMYNPLLFFKEDSGLIKEILMRYLRLFIESTSQTVPENFLEVFFNITMMYEKGWIFAFPFAHTKEVVRGRMNGMKKAARNGKTLPSGTMDGQETTSFKTLSTRLYIDESALYTYLDQLHSGPKSSRNPKPNSSSGRVREFDIENFETHPDEKLLYDFVTYIMFCDTCRGVEALQYLVVAYQQLKWEYSQDEYEFERLCHAAEIFTGNDHQMWCNTCFQHMEPFREFRVKELTDSRRALGREALLKPTLRHFQRGREHGWCNPQDQSDKLGERSLNILAPVWVSHIGDIEPWRVNKRRIRCGAGTIPVRESAYGRVYVNSKLNWERANNKWRIWNNNQDRQRRIENGLELELDQDEISRDSTSSGTADSVAEIRDLDILSILGNENGILKEEMVVGVENGGGPTIKAKETWTKFSICMVVRYLTVGKHGAGGMLITNVNRLIEI